MLTKKELKNVNQSQNFPKAEPRNSEIMDASFTTDMKCTNIEAKLNILLTS